MLLGSRQSLPLRPPWSLDIETAAETQLEMDGKRGKSDLRRERLSYGASKVRPQESHSTNPANIYQVPIRMSMGREVYGMPFGRDQ